ncbi:MAG TPA: hypothetical protein VFL99_14800 [Segeticoccus sp.]|uniref:hypothetical protein n=1 Tax=Segeticoccus sp. TaxID=2706531 RepID=UPI002D7EDBD4|nr:hypothetical protein [Segeticoccus sp.]HET8601594.1 hypothetical protein [Segeticoccus sp.]
MQGSVHRFDHETGTGSVLLDDGRAIPFPAEVFAASGLRHLRLGQRVSVEIGADEQLSRLWIVGIGADEPIR